MRLDPNWKRGAIVTKKAKPQVVVRVGQQWQSKDRRDPDRILTVLAIEGDKAILYKPGNPFVKKTRVSLANLIAGKNWTLVSETPPESWA